MKETNGRMWAIFVYASIRDRIRKDQWDELLSKSRQWGDRWILGKGGRWGDFNEIREPGEKHGGRIRSDTSCQGFRGFIEQMHMEEVEFQGRKWTWASNWHKEGFIEARFDRFFGSSKWLLENESTLVKHIEN